MFFKKNHEAPVISITTFQGLQCNDVALVVEKVFMQLVMAF